MHICGLFEVGANVTGAKMEITFYPDRRIQSPTPYHGAKIRRVHVPQGSTSVLCTYIPGDILPIQIEIHP